MAASIKKITSTGFITKGLLSLPLIVFFVIFFIIPLLKLFLLSTGDNGGLDIYKGIFAKGVFTPVFLNTAEISFGVSLFALLISFPIAYIIFKRNDRYSFFMLGLIMVPFWMSILVRSFAWIVVLQKQGLINEVLRFFGTSPHSLLYNRFSVLVGMTYVFIPYVVLILYRNFHQTNKFLNNVALSLGANKFESFLRVFLPQTYSAIFFSFLYVFIVSFGYFVTPSLLGGAKETTISMLIDIDMNQTLNWPEGAALSFLILFAIFPIILFALTVTNKNKYAE